MVQMTLSITVKSGAIYSYNDYFDDPNVVYHSGAKRGAISVEIYSPHGTRLASQWVSNLLAMQGLLTCFESEMV